MSDGVIVDMTNYYTTLLNHELCCKNGYFYIFTGLKCVYCAPVKGLKLKL